MNILTYMKNSRYLYNGDFKNKDWYVSTALHNVLV